MELSEALDAARRTRQSTLVTLKSDGKPQLSNVLHTVGEDGLIRVSVTDDRAKTRNLRREPWAALHLNVGTFWSYVVIEGDVTLSDVTTEPGDAASDELVEVYRGTAGQEHPDWDDYRRAMVEEQRLVIRLAPRRAYGLIR